MEEPKIQGYYLGKLYPVLTAIDLEQKKPTIEWNGEKFLYKGKDIEKDNISKALKIFYTKASKKLIEERLKLYQKQFKIKYKSFTIENDHRKWGSCNSKRQLTFYWKLIIFPLEAVDYVVAHEMCHLMHMNHDRSFWRLLGKVYPKYKEAMAIIGAEKTRGI